MVEEKRPEGTAERYDGYVAELREFFASRSVRFGKPEDVVPFAALVSQPGPFGDEMGSMLRSILYTEDERLSREDLLMLVTLAVGDAPLQSGMPGIDDALRQLFRFVHAAMRQRGSFIPPEAAGEPGGEELVSPGAASMQNAGPEPMPPFAADAPGRGYLDTPAPVAASTPRPESGREGMLLRAVTMSAQEAEALGDTGVPAVFGPESPVPAATAPAEETAKTAPIAETPAAGTTPSGAARRRPRGKIWLVPAGAFAGAAGVLLYLLWPTLAHFVAARRAADGTGLAAAVPVSAASATRSCMPPMGAGASRVALEERTFVAHNLMDQQMYGAALQQLQAVAQADPGFPGIHLDESDAWLHMKQPDRAREAIDAQIGISDCLAGLPTTALNAYCTTQFSASTAGACRPQLAHIRQAAELQAALVHLELGHRIDPDDGAAAAMKELQQSEANEGAPARPARLKTAGQRRARRD